MFNLCIGVLHIHMNKDRFKKILLLVALFTFTSSVFATVFSPQSTSAANIPATEVAKPGSITFKRINYAVIQDSNNVYWKVSGSTAPTDQPNIKFIKDGSTDNSQYIQTDPTSASWNSELRVYTVTSSAINGTTATYYKTGLKANDGPYELTYYWIDQNTIGRYGVNADNAEMPAVIYKYDATSKYFIEPYTDPGECPDRIKVSGNTANITVAAPAKDGNINQYFGLWNDNGTPHARYLKPNEKTGACNTATSNKNENGAINITFSNNKNIPVGTNVNSVTASTPAGSASSGADNNCYANIPVFGWMLCPMLDLADQIYGFAKAVVAQLLYINESAWSGASSGSGLYQSWSIMRNLASALLVLVALAMIAGQIFNFEFMSAYTVKKVLPRLVIAAIAIQLSWFIFTTMIIFTNALGAGIYGLLTAPFSINGGDIMDITGTLAENSAIAGQIGSIAVFAGVSAAIAVGVVGIATAGSLLTLVLVAIGVIISIMIVIVTLIVRKMLIIVLLALAPLALVAWILPSTQRFWDMWWKLFSRLLLMFPLIMILFAAGAIGASILANQTNPSATDFIAVIIIYFIPLFLIPSTFKFAGGMFNTIVSAIDKGGNKVKGSGMFGLRDQAKDQKEYMKKKNLDRYNMQLGNDDVSGIKRGWARYKTGNTSPTFGYGRSGKYLRKRTELAGQAGLQLHDKELAEEAATEFGNQYQTLSPGEQKDYIEALHDAKSFDDDIILYKKDAQGKYELDASGKKIVSKNLGKATAAKRIGSLETTIQFKKQDRLKKSIDLIRGSGDEDATRSLKRALASPIVDERMTDLSRGAQIGAIRRNADGSLAERVVDRDGNVTEAETGKRDQAVFNKMFGSYDKMDDITKGRLRDQVASESGDNAVVADRLYRFATNPEIHEADFKAMADTPGINVTVETLMAVQQAKGGLTLANVDGTYIAVSSTSGAPAGSAS